ALAGAGHDESVPRPVTGLGPDGLAGAPLLLHGAVGPLPRPLPIGLDLLVAGLVRHPILARDVDDAELLLLRGREGFHALGEQEGIDTPGCGADLLLAGLLELAHAARLHLGVQRQLA